MSHDYMLCYPYICQSIVSHSFNRLWYTPQLSSHVITHSPAIWHVNTQVCCPYKGGTLVAAWYVVKNQFLVAKAVLNANKCRKSWKKWEMLASIARAKQCHIHMVWTLKCHDIAQTHHLIIYLVEFPSLIGGYSMYLRKYNCSLYCTHNSQNIYDFYYLTF